MIHKRNEPGATLGLATPYATHGYCSVMVEDETQPKLLKVTTALTRKKLRPRQITDVHSTKIVWRT